VRLVLVAALFALSCGGVATLPVSSSPATPRVASPVVVTGTPPIDVSDMMGAFPPTTFFVVRPGQVTAVALLNHATRYSITLDNKGADAPVALAVSPELQRVYVMDQLQSGVRLRWFDVVTGAEGASRTIADATLVKTTSAHATLAFDGSRFELYALLQRGATRAVEQIDAKSLDVKRRVLGDLRCGDRLLAAGGRIVMACMDEGLVVLDGTRSEKLSTFPLVALAMLPDGTLMGGARDARLVKLAKEATQLEPIDTLRIRDLTLLPDGLAAQGTCCFVAAAVRPGQDRVGVTLLQGALTLVSFPQSDAPRDGILVQPPFAYYTIGRAARHIDIQQGFAEVMATFDVDVKPGAVADR
jgi:hypothetical protein